MLKISQDIPKEPCREHFCGKVPRKFPEILFWRTFLWKFPWISPKLINIFSSYSPEWATRISSERVKRNSPDGLLEFLQNWLQEFLGIGSDFFPRNNSKKISGPGQTLATLRCSTQEFLNGESFPGNLEKISNFCRHFHWIFSW